MIDIPKEQVKWIKANFALSKRDFPTDFYEPKEIVDYLINKDKSFRGDEYKGNSMSFVEDCIMSIEARSSNKKKFELIFSQFIYLISKAEELEYYVHCEILGITGSGIKGDHIDRNGLNNQGDNLRVATYSQNNANRKSFKNSSSKYLGVGWHKVTGKWSAFIRKNGHDKHLGIFKTQEDAAIAYNNAAKLIHGEFANLNII